MSHLNSRIAVIGIDIGKNSFHLVGHDQRGAIVLRQKWSRGQMEARLANLPACGMEACVGAHHLSRELKTLGHDGRGKTFAGVLPVEFRNAAVQFRVFRKSLDGIGHFKRIKFPSRRSVL